MASIGTLSVNLVANSKNFKKGLSQGERSLVSFGENAKRVLASVGAMAAGVVSVRAMSGAINAAKIQLQAEQKLQAVITATGGAAGLTAEQIKAYASELQRMTNFGDEATINAAAMLATFKNLKGEAFLEALAAAQDMSAVLGTDLKGSVIQLGKALNDPIAGLSALSRSGVSFTEQQKEQIRTLQESGNIMGAQRIILNELSSEFGGAAAAMSDPITQLSNDMGDFGEVVGGIAANVINQFVPGLRKLFNLFQSLLKPVSGAVELFGSLTIKTLAVVGVIGAMVKVTLLLVNALKAARAAQIAFLAMTGPVGWWVITAGVGVTIGAVAALEYALDDASSAAKNLNASMKVSPIPLDQPGGGSPATNTRSPIRQTLDTAFTKLDDLRNKVGPHQQEARELLAGGASRKLVSQLVWVRKEMDAINERRQKEQELARQRESRQKSFNDLLEETRTRLGLQVGTITKIDAVLNRQRKLGIDESQLKKLRSLLELEESVAKTKKATDVIQADKKRREEQQKSELESQIESNMSAEKNATGRRADGGTFGSAKAAETILNASKQTPMVSQQKLTNKMLAKIQLTLKKERSDAFVQGEVL